MAVISSPNGETLVISKVRDNYELRIGCDTVQEDDKNNLIMMKGQKYVGEYHPPTRTLDINTDEGEVSFTLTKAEHKKFKEGLNMIRMDEELPLYLVREN